MNGKGGGGMGEDEPNAGGSHLKDRMTPRSDEEQRAADEGRVTSEQKIANTELDTQIQQRINALRAEGKDEEADRIEGITAPVGMEPGIREQQEMPVVRPPEKESALQRALRERGNK